MNARATGTRFLFAIAACLLLFCGLPCSLQAYHLIPCAAGSDLIYDDTSRILYITSADQILRYSIAADAFLPPFQIGGTLKGIDLSPDATTLAVADSTYTGDTNSGTAWVDLVDVNTGQCTKAEFARAYGEGGSCAVAYGSDGKLIVTTGFVGSGATPLRRYDPATQTYQKIPPFETLRGGSLLSASADRSAIAWECPDISSGSFGCYKVSDGTTISKGSVGVGTGAFNYAVASNRNGTQFAIIHEAITFCDSSLTKTSSLFENSAAECANAVYHPLKDILYMSMRLSGNVLAYDSVTLQKISTYDFGGTFTGGGYGVGRLAMSRDGNYLFAIVQGGVSVVRMNNMVPVGDPRYMSLDEDSSAGITLTGHDPEGEDVTFAISTPPAHGQLTGTAPDLVYTPAPNFSGTDYFSFTVKDWDAVSQPITVSINVRPSEDPPTARAKSVTVTGDKPASIRLTGSDPDGDMLSYMVLDQPAHGKLTGTAPNLTYTPDFDYHGPDAFTFKVSDGMMDSAAAAVDITVTEGAPYTTCSIGTARTLPAGSYVLINDAVVTAPNLGTAASFISSSDRSSGIRVSSTTPWTAAGQRVRLKGIVGRTDGELELKSCVFGEVQDGQPLLPVQMTTASLANDPQEDLNYTGLNVTGMLLRISGRVTAVVPAEGVVYVNDGLSCPAVYGPFDGVRVQIPGGTPLPAQESYVAVTGVLRVGKQTVQVQTERNGVQYPAGSIVYVPALWARSSSDVHTFASPQQ